MTQSKVTIRSTRDTPVDRAVRDAMEAAGWDEVVGRGDRVVLKPNLCTPSKDIIDVANTSPEVLSAICKVLKDRTDNVVIGESDGIRYSATEAFEINGTCGIAERFGFEVQSFSEAPKRSVDHPHLEGWPLPQPILDCDVFITTAKIKTHATTAFTGALKNQWGAIPQHNRLLLHKYLHTLIGEVNEILGTAFGVLDGRLGMEGRGPINGGRVPLEVVMASKDTVALDAEAMRFVGLEPRTAEHIVHAADIGLGCLEKEQIEVDSNVEPSRTFEPAEKDWPIKVLNMITRSQFLTEHLLLNDTIFYPARGFARLCRAAKEMMLGGGNGEKTASCPNARRKTTK